MFTFLIVVQTYLCVIIDFICGLLYKCILDLSVHSRRNRPRDLCTIAFAQLSIGRPTWTITD